MKRSLFTLAAALSLLLCLAVLVLWALSYNLIEGVAINSGGYTSTVCASFSGRFFLEREHLHPNGYPRPDPGIHRFQLVPPISLPPPQSVRAAGFSLWNRQHLGAAQFGVALPAWSIILATLLLPSLWIHRHATRRSPTDCPVCRYNLTANTSGTCPECGTVITRKPEVAA